MANELDKIRKEIDSIDKELQALMNKRAEYAISVGNIKKQASENPVFYRPEREAQVLRKIMERNPGPMKDKDVAEIFRAIMSAGLNLQLPIHVAYLGPDGTFSHSAAVKHFGYAMSANPQTSIDKIFKEVEAGNCEYGVIPIENSTEGVVNQSLDGFLDCSMKICGEVILPIHQCFMTKNSKDIKRIVSHQQSIAQCRNWLQEHYPNIEVIPVSSNGEAARLARDEKQTAAIAGYLAAELYELDLIHENIEDNPNNTTRFWVIGKQDSEASGDDKTSIVMSTPNKPGSLIELLTPFAKHKVELTLIESRPSLSGVWDYYFFLDFDGHQQDKAIKAALNELSQSTIMLKTLGSYPKAVI